MGASKEASTLAGRELATARSRAYGLVAALVARPLTVELLPTVEALPELAEGLVGWRGGDGRVELLRAAEAHERVLGREVPPLQSAFLSERARCGEAESERLHAALAAASAAPPALASDPVDHLAWLCRALSRSCAVEADAAAEGARGSGPPALAAAQRALLEEHLLRWLAPLQRAVAAAGEPLFARALAMLAETAVHHALSLAAAEPARWALPEPDVLTLLDEPGTSLATIGEALARPAACGAWLGSGELRAIGAALELPTGFGRRGQRLTALLRGAADHDRLPALCEALASRLAMPDDPCWLGREEPWLTRQLRTREALERLARGASALADEETDRCDD